MPSRSRKISNTFVNWLVDFVIEHLVAIIALVYAVVVTYFAAISILFEKYGPISWATAGIATYLIVNFGYLIYAYAKQITTRSELSKLALNPTASINRLERLFQTSTIKMQDLVDPVDNSIRNKTLTDCDLIGPINFGFLNNVTVSGAEFVNCNFVVVTKSYTPATVVLASEVQIIRGRLIGVTFFIDDATRRSILSGTTGNGLENTFVNG